MTENKNTCEQRLQRILEKVVSQSPIRHAIIAVESGDLSFRWHTAAGEPSPDGTPVQPDTPFFIASIDKLFNAVLIMMLSEEGLVDIDAPLSAYLPGELIRGLHVFRGTDHTHSITIRHLLSHASGLAEWLEDRPKGGTSLVERMLKDGDTALDIEGMLSIVRHQLNPHFPPQDLSSSKYRIRYSDTNYILLMEVIEAVTGKPLRQVHAERFIAPLSLRHTWFAGNTQPAEITLPPATLSADGKPLSIPGLIQSVRGIYSTTADLITFMRSLVGGRLFKDPSTFERMQQRWNTFGLPLDPASLRAPSWPIQYGLGMIRFRLPRIFSPLHDAPPLVGHTGSTGCWLFHCPQWDLYFCGSVDEVSAGAVPYRIAYPILRAARED